MSTENSKSGGFVAESLAGLFIFLSYMSVTDFSDHDSESQKFILIRDMSTLIIGGIIIWITFKGESGSAFLNFIGLVLGIFIYYLAEAYGITIFEFFDKSSFIGKTGKFIGGIIVPSIVGYGISKLSINIYSKNAKIRLGILLLTMFLFVVRELFNGKIEYVFTDTLEKAKPNIFFLTGTLLNLIFHPVSDD